MAWEELQPSNIFSKEKISDVDVLVRKQNDKFWILPIAKYEDILIKNISFIKNIDKGSREYLIGLVKFMQKKINEKELSQLYLKNNIPETDIIKNFGEVLGPFFALNILEKKSRAKLYNIIFPTRQNYEIFDFFIKDHIHFGFSSKALVGGSNPLVPRLFIERLDKMKNKGEFKNYKTEIDVLRELTEGGMYSGVVNAFELMIESGKIAKGFDRNVFSIFKKTNFKSDAQKFESNKERFISSLNLSDQKSYELFLNNYIFENISNNNKMKTKQLAKKDRNGNKNGYGYLSVNVIYGMIKYLSSVPDFQFEELMKKLFPDLNIIKMGLNKTGVPIFRLQTTIDAKTVFKLKTFEVGGRYAFRSKASWDTVRDKLGIQL